MSKTQKQIDVFIKDEGYAAIRFITNKAKNWAFHDGVSNSLTEQGFTKFCGRPVWSEKSRKGLYRSSISFQELRKLKKMIFRMREAGLSIESEIE